MCDERRILEPRKRVIVFIDIEIWKFRFGLITATHKQLDNNIVSITLYSMSPTSALSNFISCIPIMENKVVSKLQKKHLKIIGDDSVGKEVLVKIDKLGLLHFFG